MRQILFTVTLLTLTLASLGQTTRAIQAESFVTLTDTLIRNEIAMFNFKGALPTANVSVKRPALTEIPLKSCDGTEVNFHKGSTFIHLYFKAGKEHGEPGTTKELDSIFLVTHSHFWVKFPKSSFDGLSNLISCDISINKRSESISSTFFKSFQSNDKRRIYIYMIGGLDGERYEVTWVIKDDKFFTRTIDPI